MNGTVVLSTTNHAKIEQARRVAGQLGIKLTTSADLARETVEYEEIGETTREVAINGALDVAAALGVTVLVEDSIAQCPALCNQPGIRAGAFLKAHGRQGLLDLAADLKGRDRKIVVESSTAAATPDGKLLGVWTHQIHGTLLHEEQVGDSRRLGYFAGRAHSGSGGYLPLVCPDEYAGQVISCSQLSDSWHDSRGLRAKTLALGLTKLSV